MILEKQTEATVLSEGNSQDSIGMSLDLDSAQILMQMLSKNLYSDAIGSTIREWASNALDSHRRSGQTKPIIVSLKANQNNNYDFTVEDFGMGLDADDVKNVISKYGKSTKRNSNNELGMFGLGFKVGLAYGSSFYFVCRKNGVERKYMMYEGEDVNTIDLLYEQSTNEPNGVKMILCVNYYDRRDFVTKIKEQLAYFDNVYFDIYDEQVKNDFIIFRGEHFQYSELITDNNLHLCLDNVYYPLDFKKLGIDKIEFPLALRFDLTEGITPIPNREQLMYSKETKQAILAKIGKVADFFAERFNVSITKGADIYAIIEFYNNRTKPVKGFNNDQFYDFIQLEKFSSVKLTAPKLANVNLLDLKWVHSVRDYILSEYNTKYILKGGVMREAKSWDKDISFGQFNKNQQYIYKNKISGIKKEWLKSLPVNNGYNKCFIKKEKEFTLGNVKRLSNYSTYVTLCNLSKYPKSQWRQVIKEFQYIKSLVTSQLIDLDALEIPQDWLDQRKAIKDAAKIKLGLTPVTRRIKLQGEVIGKEACPLEKFVQDKNAKFVSTVYQLKDFHQRNFLTVYGKDEDVPLMDKLFTIFKNTKFVNFSDREIKRLQGVSVHNLISLSKFMEGKNKVFQRVATAQLIYTLRKKYPNTFSKKHRLNDVSKTLCNNLDILYKYEMEYRDSRAHSSTITAILNVAIENNIFDEPIKMIHDDIKSLFEKLPFIELLFTEISSYSKEDGKDSLTDTICALFKYYKQRIDWKNYKQVMVLNEDVSEELTEELTEEIVEGLLQD